MGRRRWLGTVGTFSAFKKQYKIPKVSYKN